MTGLTLKKVTRISGHNYEEGLLDGETLLEYSAKHNNNTSTLDLDINVKLGHEGAVASMEIKCPPCVDEEAALDKLADWLERTAKAIRVRKAEGASIKLYGTQPMRVHEP